MARRTLGNDAKRDNAAKTKVDDRRRYRLRSLCNVFTKTNRILTGDRQIAVKLADDYEGYAPPGAPGWNVYPNIYINYGEFGNLKSAETLVQLLGLNYHEVSHLMFTDASFPVQSSHRISWNILEDQRIESLFTALYPPAAKYFTAMCVRFYVEKGDASSWASAFLLTYGRSYLPLEIRQEFEDRFTNPDVIDEAKGIINAYKELSKRDFSDLSKRSEIIALIYNFHNLLHEYGGQDQSHCDDHTNRPYMDDSKDQSSSEEKAKEIEKERREKEEETGEDQSGFWDDDDEENSAEGSEEGDEDVESEEGEGEEGDEGGSDSDSASGDSDESDDEGDGGDSGSREGDGSDDGDADSSDGDGGPDGGSEGEVDDSTEEIEDEEGGDGVGGGGLFDGDDEFEDYLNEVASSVFDDEDVDAEVDQVSKAIDDFANVDVIDFGEVDSSTESISPSLSASLNAVTREFRRIYADVEPGWNYGSNVGRLNVGRALLDPENYDEMFDEWDEGREHESGMEVVVSFDMSISMTGPIDNEIGGKPLIYAASEALWVIKRALDDVEAKTTVIGFHAATFGVYSGNEKAPRTHVPIWNVGLGGDTQPAFSMALARRIMAQSKMPNKLYILITDGALGNTDIERSTDVNLPEVIGGIGATKMYVNIGDEKTGYSTVNFKQIAPLFDHSVQLKDPMDLVEIVKGTVTQMVENRRR